jgi:ABC-type phosphate transport system substrate-binding protein
MSRRLLSLLVLAALVAGAKTPASFTPPAAPMAAASPAEPLVVVVNPASGVTRLTQEEVVNLFMARMYFSGQAQPPRQARNSQEVIEVVLANPGAIGFVEQSKVDKRVRAVLVLTPP